MFRKNLDLIFDALLLGVVLVIAAAVLDHLRQSEIELLMRSPSMRG